MFKFNNSFHILRSFRNKANHESKNLNLNLNRRSFLRLPFIRLTLGSAVALLTAYDGVVNDFTYCRASWRFVRSLKTATLIAADYILLERYENDPNYDEKLKIVHQRCADRLLQTCLLNGGLYIKVGQGFAAINHILPDEYTKTLSKLQDRCLPTTIQDVQKVFLQDFGCLPEDIYAKFDYKAIAAASLAQVFKAQMKSGECVAVKVQYSDLQRRFPSDLGTIIFLHDIVEFFFNDYNFGWILRDVHKNLIHELDFENEGKNAERAAKNLAKFKFVHIPTVYWSHTKKRVLTMEWIDGIRVSDIEEIEANNLNLRDVDLKLFKTFAEQIFNAGFVHADPHSSNVFVRPHKSNGRAEVILLDHGLYEEIPKHIRLPLCAFWEATVLRDEKAMETAAKKLHIKDYIKFAEVLFQQPIRIHSGRIVTKLTEADVKYMQEVAKKNFDIIMSTLKEMPRNMLFVVRNLNTIRAIGRSHKDVVDRPRVMARHAQKCLYTHSGTATGYIRWMYKRIYFEFCLWRTSFKLTCFTFYLRVLYFLGRAPESATTIMQNMLPPDVS